MEALDYSMRKWNRTFNTEFMQVKRQRSRYCLWTQKSVDWQGRRLWDFMGKLLLFACLEWTSIEKYIIVLCDGSLHFLGFFGWLSCVQCSLNMKFLWICYIVLSFQAYLGGMGSGRNVLKHFVWIIDGRGLEDVQFIHPGKNTLFYYILVNVAF